MKSRKPVVPRQPITACALVPSTLRVAAGLAACGGGGSDTTTATGTFLQGCETVAGLGIWMHATAAPA